VNAEIIKLIREYLPQGPFDALGVGIIDFKKLSYTAIEGDFFERKTKLREEPFLYFDLASLTKPLSNSLAYFLRPGAFDEKLLLALNHRGGIPTWGLLATTDWEEQILGYPVHESETAYSDFSALRVLLELERKGVNEKELCSTVWDGEVLFWKDLPFHFPAAKTAGRKNGVVHDPNAFVINEFTSHAGLFGTTDGLCRTLLNYQKKTDFIEKVHADSRTHERRFSFGWDRVSNPDETLAGKGCGKFTFGHLGFTGTSIWIDPEKMIGHVILSNAVKNHWYDKKTLNEFRRAVGASVWSVRTSF
jgi:Beta-lactamase